MEYRDILACGLLLLVIIYKIFFNKRIRKNKTIVARKEKIIVVLLILISLIFFVIDFLLNVKVNGANVGSKETIRYFINALTIALIVFPIDLIGLYNSMFKDEEKYCNLKTIVTNMVDEDLFLSFNKAHINVIIIKEDENTTGYKVLKKDEVKKKDLESNCFIFDNDIHVLDKWLSNDTTIYECKDLNELYYNIMKSRLVYDNYLRIIKYLIITYLPILLSYILLTMEGFPFVYDLLLIVGIKIITIIQINVLYKNLPYDVDIEQRHPKDKNILMSNQELLFTFAQGFINLFAMTIPYMLVLSLGGELSLAFSLYLLVFIFANIFSTYSMINDSFIVKIVYKNIFSLRLMFYLVTMILLSFIVVFTDYFATINVGLKNYTSCILFGFATIALNEFVKLARYRGKKGKDNNGIKNNKKCRRS